MLGQLVWVSQPEGGTRETVERELCLDHLPRRQPYNGQDSVDLLWGIVSVKVNSNYSGLKKQAGFSLKIHDALS